MDYATIGRKLEKLYPYLAKELLTVPDCTEVKMIDQLFAKYATIQSKPSTKSEETHFKLVFIGAILKLYDPDFYDIKKQIKSGLRKNISKTLSCDASLISHNLKIVKNYMDVYPAFRNEVSYIHSELKKLL